MRKLTLAVISACLLAFVYPSHANDTYSATESDKKFFSQLQAALKQDDFNWLSQAICSYPFKANLENGCLDIKSEKDLKKYAKTIFNSALKGDVLNQSSKSLFKNWQGVMIGDGDIWFSKLGEKKGTNIVWTYKIIGINVPHGRKVNSAHRS